jgi:hypothetical protein
MGLPRILLWRQSLAEGDRSVVTIREKQEEFNYSNQRISGAA